MNNIKLLLLIFGFICSINIFSQEEFVGNNSAFTLSYSDIITRNTDNADVNSKGFGYYNKVGLFVSCNLTSNSNRNSVEGSIGYLFDGSKIDNELKTFFALSYGSAFESQKYAGTSIGLIKVFFPTSNFPFSVGASSSAILFLKNDINQNAFQNPNPNVNLLAAISYTQAFFSKYRFYPLIGITKTFIISNYGSSNLLYHIGLNVRLNN